MLYLAGVSKHAGLRAVVIDQRAAAGGMHEADVAAHGW